MTYQIPTNHHQVLARQLESHGLGSSKPHEQCWVKEKGKLTQKSAANFMNQMYHWVLSEMGGDYQCIVNHSFF